jgi:probable rRNA maturation factor
MILKLELNNTTKEKFSKKFFQEIFFETISTAGMECLAKKTVHLSMALVDEDEIRKLNSEYRKKDKPTDVLSFCEYEKKEHVCEDARREIFLGELIVCVEYVASVSKEEKEPLEYSLKYIAAHGILHLLGFSHGPKMFSLQKKVADKLENKKKKYAK